MARSVTYSVVPRINPSEKSAPPRYYAQAQARGSISIREMAERIQRNWDKDCDSGMYLNRILISDNII